MTDSINAELRYCYSCMNPLSENDNKCPICGSTNQQQNPKDTLPEGTILAGKYFVGRLLGRGGFGITYLGFDLSLNIRVAIKEYFPVGVCSRSTNNNYVHTISDLIEKNGFERGCKEFQSEAMKLALFNSPNIVHVRDYFQENGTSYIVMDYIAGNTLTKEVAEHGGKLRWDRVMSLFQPLITELEKLHNKNLIHRDIKPDNLKIIKDENGYEHLVLLDFGAARRFVSENVTNTYTAMVTPGYAPFEQYIQKSHQGPYTDIYALCATMYASITGEVPAAAPDRVAELTKIKPFSDFGISTPACIEKTIMHGLEIKSENRPQTMKELNDEFLGGKPKSDTLNIDNKTDQQSSKHILNPFLLISLILIIALFILLKFLISGSFNNIPTQHTNKINNVETTKIYPTDNIHYYETQTAISLMQTNVIETQSAVSATQTKSAMNSAAEIIQRATQNAVVLERTRIAKTQSAIMATQTKNAEIKPIQVIPTATNVSNHIDKASFDSQTPMDGTHIQRGQPFEITWYLLNTGTTTWTTDYSIRFFSNNNFTKQGKDRWYLEQPVPPNTVGKCTVDAVAPATPGTYTMAVVLGNGNGENFYIMDISIVVD